MLLTSRPSKTRGSLFGSQLTHNNIPQTHHHPWKGLLGRLDKSLGQIFPSPHTPLHTIRRPTTLHFHPDTPSITSDMHRPLPNMRSPSHRLTKQGNTNHTPRIPRPQRRQSHHIHTSTTHPPHSTTNTTCGIDQPRPIRFQFPIPQPLLAQCTRTCDLDI